MSQTAQLRAETERMTALLDGDATLPVDGCPGWTLRDLGAHLGNIHRWAAAQVAAAGERQDLVEEAPPEDLAGWYAGCAAGMLAVLEAASPDDPAWGFGPRPRTAAFWSRRQLHETAVHRWDAERARGLPASLDAALAADGLAEALTVFVPRQVVLGRTPPLPHALELHGEEGGRWRLGPDGPAAATLHGPAEALLLLLWRRTTLDDPRLRVEGDHGRGGRGAVRRAAALMTVETAPATADRFDDVAVLLGPKNPASSVCWCLSHRLDARTNRELVGPARGEHVRSLCSRDVAPGVLAYDDDQVVGWAAVAPRSELPFARSRKIPHVDDLPVWSLWCVRVRPGFRGRGIASSLLEGAVAYARQNGAPAVEGYPVDNQGRRVDLTMAYVGTGRCSSGPASGGPLTRRRSPAASRAWWCAWTSRPPAHTRVAGG